MAFEMIIKTVTFIAEAAMTATDYRFVKLGTSAQQCNMAGAGEAILGIRRNSPAVGGAVEVVLPGQITKLTVGSGGVTKDCLIKSGAAGEAIISTADRENIGAIALEAGAEGEVVSVLVTRFQSSHA